MNTKDKVKIECLKQGKTLADIARELKLTRHNYYFHLRNENINILKKTENILDLKEGYFTDQLPK